MEKTLKHLLALLLGLAWTASSASAAPVLYNINFTGFITPPTSGSFRFDHSTSTFSDFIVIWNSVTFNLTAAANAPTITGTCDTPQANSLDYFSYLNGSGCGIGLAREWGVATRAQSGTFVFDMEGGAVPNVASASIRAGTHTLRLSDHITGNFTIQEAGPAIPEPSTAAFVVTGGLLLVWNRRRERHPQRR